jgi:predicted nucleic acid-binding protein
VGTLTLPNSGSVDVDANSVIYGVEKHPIYGPLLQPLWDAASAKVLEIVSSDLVLMETLIGPLKSGDKVLASTYEAFFQQPQTRLMPITHAILRREAQLRATTRLKTPDALHAATAMDTTCRLFVTNDAAYRNVPGLSVAVLDELLKP